MKAVSYFIIEPEGGSVSDHKEVGGVILSTNMEDHKNYNRFATVTSTPLGYGGPIVEGDKIVVHHNVFRRYNDMYGKRRDSSSLIRGDKFLAGDAEIFAFYRDGKWESVYPYVFLSTETLHHGEILISSEKSSENGFGKGKKFYYTPDSEYEFEIDGVKMYRMTERDICAS